MYLLINGYFWTIVFILSAILILLLLLLIRNQDSILYHPHKTTSSELDISKLRPDAWNLPYEDINFRTKDGCLLHSWLLLQPGESARTAPTVVYLHGNAGFIGGRLPNYAGLYFNVGVNVLCLDYRGYGQSLGVPSEVGLVQDAQAAIGYLKSRPDLDSSRIIIMGSSLGGAVALATSAALGSSAGIAGVIVENTFMEVAEMAKNLFPLSLCRFPSALIRTLLKSTWRNDRNVLVTGNISRILFLASTRDEIIPHSHMLQLFALASAAQAGKHVFHAMPGAGHNNAWLSKQYYDPIIAFVQLCVPGFAVPERPRGYQVG